MNERMEVSGAGQEEIPQGLLASMAIEEGSPEFQILKTAVREELQKDVKKPFDEQWVNFMTHMKVIQSGMDEDHRRTLEKIKNR